MSALKYDTVIVGGGIAGLTCAAYLARAGKKIILIEKNNEFGGLVSSFISDGFHFEAGVRALVNAGIILPMLKDLGIKLDVIRSKVSVGIENRIINIEDESNIDDYRKLLVELYPESEKEIDDFIIVMRKIMKHLDVLYGIENPLFKNLKKDYRYIFRKLLPWFPKFLFTVSKINRLNQPVEDYLRMIIKNQSLRDIISQHFFKGTPAFFALSYFSLYLDYFYPAGGVGRLARVLEDKIIEYKGELKPNTRITEIDAANKFVTDENNNRYEYKNLVWAADSKTFYSITRTEGLPLNIQRNFEAFRKKIIDARGSESVFTLYLQTDLPLEYFGKISHGHFFYTPSRKGLGEIHTAELQELLENFENKSKKEILSWLNRFLELNTFEISIPGLKYPELAPEGKTGLIISFLVEYDLFEKIKNSGWYEELVKETERKIILILSQSVYPGLENRILKQFSFTPLSIRNRVGTTDGSIVGWSFRENVPIISKIQSAGKSVLTPVPGIFQAGQWVYRPAGVPMSILTGKIAADRICK